MIRAHPFLSVPERSVIIWRYQDLAKFISLLTRRALYFPTVAQLEDPWEGALTGSEFLMQALVAHSISSKSPVVRRDDLVAGMTAANKEKRDLLRVSCWYCADGESAAMWRLYCKTNEAIAIKATVGSLTDALDASPQLTYLGLVDYSKFDKGTYSSLPFDLPIARFFCKRRSFEHERELRAAVPDRTLVDITELPSEAYPLPIPPDPGLYIPIDPSKLISSVHLAPTSPKWFEEVVRSTVAALGYNFTVVRSSLDDSPLF